MAPRVCAQTCSSTAYRTVCSSPGVISGGMGAEDVCVAEQQQLKHTTPATQAHPCFHIHAYAHPCMRASPTRSLPGGVSAKGGRWVVNLDLAGELYQAYFDTQDDAQEAYNAAGATTRVPVPA